MGDKWCWREKTWVVNTIQYADDVLCTSVLEFGKKETKKQTRIQSQELKL